MRIICCKLVAPKMFQAVLAAVADYCTYSLGKRLMGGTIAPYLVCHCCTMWDYVLTSI